MKLAFSLATAAAVGLTVALAPVEAHHAVQAQFDVNTIVEKKGTLFKVDWVNPHTHMHFEVSENGKVKKYDVESLGILGLRLVGIDKSVFKIGESFTFTVNPARNGSDSGLLVMLQFPDGRRFEFRPEGRIRSDG